VPNYVKIIHQQLEIYTGEVKIMPIPSYTVVDFNGINLVLRLNFTDPGSLSKSIAMTLD
jgi:hypothetical protein